MDGPDAPLALSQDTPRQRIAVSDLTAGKRIRTLLMVKRKRLDTTRAGSSYLALVLGDQTGEIHARVWDDVERYAPLFGEADFLFIEGVTETYRGDLQLRVSHLERVDESAVDLADFIPSSRFDPDEMLGELDDLIRTEVSDPVVQGLLTAILRDPGVSDGLLRAPAAKANHHAYLGGLLEHTLSLCQLAVRMGRHYEILYPDLLSTDLLIAGALLHDLGKIWELSADRTFEYTDAGRLVGHIVLGTELVDRVMARQGIDDTELALRLKHMVLSHHGELEYGAPVRPVTPEAQLLHYLDQIDSRVNMYARAIDEAEGSWSGWVSPLRRSVYAGGVEAGADSEPARPAPSEPKAAPPPRSTAREAGDATTQAAHGGPLDVPEPPPWLDIDEDAPPEESSQASDSDAPFDLEPSPAESPDVAEAVAPPDEPPPPAERDDHTLDLFGL